MPQRSRIAGKTRDEAKVARRKAIEAQYGLSKGFLDPTPLATVRGEPRKLVEAYDRATKYRK